MLLLKSHPKLSSFLKPKSTNRLCISSVSHNIKLLEVPDICTSEEWNNTLQESRTSLQKYVNRYQHLNIEGNRNLASESMVIERLQACHSSSHLVNTFKYLLKNSDETTHLLRWPGLITLMLSQGIGYNFTADDFCSKALEDVIWSSQVVLAEIINILHYSLVFRKENWRLSSSTRKSTHLKAMKEVDRLMQSYFTSSSINKFSALQKYKENFKVIYLLSDVLESLSRTTNSCTPSFNYITNKSLWEYDTFHSLSILLATGCQATLELAKQDENSQQMAYEFGHLFTLAIKANADIQQFWNYQIGKTTIINLSGFPIALYLESNPEALEYIYSCGKNVSNLDADQLNAKCKPNLLLNEAKEHLQVYTSRTLKILQGFKSCQNIEMIEYLMKLVKTLNFIDEK